MSNKRNLRRLSVLVTAQTYGSLERLAKMCGYRELGRVVDKLVWEKMVSLKSSEGYSNKDKSRI